MTARPPLRGLPEYEAVNALPSPLNAPLRCHPATPAGVPLALAVEVQTRADGLWLRYTLRGDTGALRIPAPAAPVATDGLWQHSCFEAFVGVESDAAYREFNISPSSQWAAYRFAAERERDTAAEAREPAPSISTRVQRDAQCLQLSVCLPSSALPRGPAPLSLGLSAVIEEADGRLSYWALHHPGERPDFHHAAGRTLRLAAP